MKKSDSVCVCVHVCVTINRGGNRTQFCMYEISPKNNIYTCVQPYYPQNDKSKTSYFVHVNKKHTKSLQNHTTLKIQLVRITNVSVI